MKNIHIPVLDYSVAASLIEPSETSDKALLWLMGRNSARSNDFESKIHIASLSEHSLLIFDYSGHGDSPFEFDATSPAQHFLEVVTVFDWLAKQYPETNISVCGGSYGGYFAALLTNYRSFEQLILRAPAIYPPNNFYTKWRNYNEHETQLYRLNESLLLSNPTINSLNNYKGRALIIQHELDTICPPETIKAYRHALVDSDYFLSARTEHSLVSAPKDVLGKYTHKIASWLNE